MAQIDVDEMAVPDKDLISPAPRYPRKPSRAAVDEDEVDNEDDGASSRPPPEEVLRLIMTELSVSPEIAGAALGIGRNSAYQAIHKKQIAANCVGNKLTCPTAPLRRQLGLEPPLAGGEPAPQIALQPKKQETIKSPKQRRRRKQRKSLPLIASHLTWS